MLIQSVQEQNVCGIFYQVKVRRLLWYDDDDDDDENENDDDNGDGDDFDDGDFDNYEEDAVAFDDDSLFFAK